MTTIAAALPLPPVFYCGSTRSYYRAESRGRWIALNENSALKFIRLSGHTGRGTAGLDAADECLLRVQSEQSVDYVGPLAGYRAGPHQIHGRLVLVTDSPVVITPEAGRWDTLQFVLEGMFGDQLPYVYGWLKLSCQSVAEGRWSPAQVFVMAGPVSSGKSLFQRLVTEMLGGRAAKPFKYLTDRTQFNGDLFGAEHLMVEDEAESIDIRARRHFGAGIKAVAVNQDHQCHGKHREGLVLTPCWRMTISLNDEPERMQVLPPMDSDVADKVLLLRVNHTAMPMPTESPEQKAAFWTTIRNELPAFLHFLQGWEIPPGLRSPRFGIRHYHHPELLEALGRSAPENRLLALVDQVIFSQQHGLAQHGPWEGTAEDLERMLNEEETLRRPLQQLLTFSSACGTYLGRLAGQPPSRVSSRKLHGQTRWVIQPPQGEGVDPVADNPPGPRAIQTFGTTRNTPAPPPLGLMGEGVRQVSHELMRN